MRHAAIRWNYPLTAEAETAPGRCRGSVLGVPVERGIRSISNDQWQVSFSRLTRHASVRHRRGVAGGTKRDVLAASASLPFACHVCDETCYGSVLARCEFGEP